MTDKIPYVFTWLLESTSFGVDTILVCQFVLACITVLPATILMGGVFPLTVRVAAARLDTVGRDVGSAYALNTVGAIVGSFLSGFVVLPVLGLQKGIYVAVLGGLLLAAALFVVAPGLSRARRTAGAGAAVVLALVGLILPRWDLVSFSAGFFRVSIAREYIYRKIHKKAWKHPKLVFYEDGIATTVTVDQWGKTYSLKNNGKVDASNDGDMATQIIVGLLPLLLYRGDAPPKVALVGYGSGVTAGAITQYPIASLEVVELEPAIYRASRFFDNDNHRPLENPKVTARVGRRAKLPGPAPRQVRRHRQPAVEPVAHRRVEPVHARVLPRRQDAPGARTASSASGRSCTRWRPGTSRPSTARCARSSPTSTCSPPRTCRRTRS